MTMLGVQQPAAAVFGDTTLTKVFVGGLAWETHKDTLREHFDRFGDILEAVIISDKLTGRSKGYGFVSSRDPNPTTHGVLLCHF
jgi:RNA recognition motif-containing protein